MSFPPHCPSRVTVVAVRRRGSRKGSLISYLVKLKEKVKKDIPRARVASRAPAATVDVTPVLVVFRRIDSAIWLVGRVEVMVVAVLVVVGCINAASCK